MPLRWQAVAAVRQKIHGYIYADLWDEAQHQSRPRQLLGFDLAAAETKHGKVQ